MAALGGAIGRGSDRVSRGWRKGGFGDRAYTGSPVLLVGPDRGRGAPDRRSDPRVAVSPHNPECFLSSTQRNPF